MPRSVDRRQKADINDALVTVAGVLPASFDFASVFSPGSRFNLFSPFPLTDETNRWGNTLAIIGRLKPGATLDSSGGDRSGCQCVRLTIIRRSTSWFARRFGLLRWRRPSVMHSAHLSLSGMLFGVTASDPVTFLRTVLVLFGLAALAAYLHARRASLTDPMLALRGN